MFTAGEWHSLCDDGFGMSNAEVICKSLGYSSKCHQRHGPVVAKCCTL